MVVHMENNMSLKSNIKNIVDHIINVLNCNTIQLMQQYVSVYPQKSCIDNNRNYFLNNNLVFLQDMKKITNDLIFKLGYIDAALSFFKNADISIIEQKSIYDISSGIYACRISNEDVNVFVVNISSVDFEALYSEDAEYFNYLIGNSDPENNYEYTSASDALLAFYFSANNRNCKTVKKNIIILCNDEFKYKRIDFSKVAKNYLIENLKRNLRIMGIKDNFDNMEFVPYDLYFNSLCSGSVVNYFISQLSNAYQKYDTKLKNIGMAIELCTDELITLFAFASNNHVGTYYYNEMLETLKYKHEHMPNPIIIEKAKYVDCECRTLFKSLSKIASANLKLLKITEVLRTLFTSEWLYANIGNIENFDNTFICFGYFKAVETLLSSVLIIYFEGQTIEIKKCEDTIISKETSKYFTLGNMMRFLLNNNFSRNNVNYNKLINEKFTLWRKKIRNGYFHKDLIDAKEVTHIRNITFEVIYIILGILPY